MSGHDHDLEILRHAGVAYIVCGGFGGLPDPSRTYTSSASLWYQAGQLGFVDAGISGRQADLNFLNPEGGLIEHFSVVKSQ